MFLYHGKPWSIFKITNQLLPRKWFCNHSKREIVQTDKLHDESLRSNLSFFSLHHRTSVIVSDRYWLNENFSPILGLFLKWCICTYELYPNDSKGEKMKELIKMSSTIFVTGNIYAIDRWNYFCLRNGNLDLFEKSKLELLTSSSLNIVPLAIFYF